MKPTSSRACEKRRQRKESTSTVEKDEFTQVSAFVSSGLPQSHPVGALWVPLSNLNPYITCGICKGYLYEASTITECMHTYCKSCIVKHCERSVNCPLCKIIIHPTDPFVNIKLDRTLQDIVYKLLPHVAEEEQSREDKFYEEHPRDVRETLQVAVRKTPNKSKVLDDDFIVPVSLILENKGWAPEIPMKSLDKNYVRVMGGATIDHIAMFLMKKLHLRDTVDQSVQVDIYCSCGSGSICLDGTRTLQAVKQLYCQEQEFLLLQYLVRVS
ncbi:polycomb group RING finger protein 6-like isoform X2 [Gigantopelta aegis]|uniref:polycomb group RING finger protein 6-like isoform X2 n=1 Tax=Gigantopelta aegis TaxID=1735272 RepID=UPI001B88E42B|nr:polycomb group RING finger protein 6-like isoform X2 [Gigantopelta aegis]